MGLPVLWSCFFVCGLSTMDLLFSEGTLSGFTCPVEFALGDQFDGQVARHSSRRHCEWVYLSVELSQQGETVSGFSLHGQCDGLAAWLSYDVETL